MTAQQWTSKPRSEDIARLRRAVAAYAVGHGLARQRVDDVKLAVSEIVSNAVVHAYRDGGDGTITVVASVDGRGAMIVRVADDGLGLSPRADSPGAGLGLIIARQVADRLEIERPQRGGTAVRLTFAAAA
ncbi:MAG: ATP-binding protein [Solirubrobacteraceae bacterium]